MKRVLIVFAFLILLFISILGGFFISKKEIVYFEQEEIKEQFEEMPETEKFTLTEELKKIVKNLTLKAEKFIKERERLLAIEKARARSENVKGVYMTAFIANSQSPVVIKIRDDIKKLIFETELNAIVIDVKEAYGPNLPNSLKKLIEEFKEKDIWVIARICVFRDSSLIKEKPNLYLQSKKGGFWKDNSGNFWLDPASPEVLQYIIEFSKRAIDFGFDELQFDYIRFPSDGDLEDIVFPFYNKKKSKWKVIQEFMEGLTQELKTHKPEIILSIDLFGLVVLEHNVPEIGQRLEDSAKFFDFLSPMLYPSHFYGGFQIGKDLKRNLPALYFPYEAEDISKVVSNHPYEVVYRSILSAKDYLRSLKSKAKIRPWLQDFSLKADSERGIYYDAEKVKAQIKAAEDSGASGWLLWNPANIYSEEIFKK